MSMPVSCGTVEPHPERRLGSLSLVVGGRQLTGRLRVLMLVVLVIGRRSALTGLSLTSSCGVATRAIVLVFSVVFLL